MESGHFEIVRLLGEGGFGKVFLIQDTKDPNIKHAMKVMQISKMDDVELNLALQEIQLLSTLDHKYLLSYVTCFRQDDYISIVTEFCPNGDLSDYIENQHGTALEEPRLVEWFRQIASAVEYLHGLNIIHRDLKTQNVFLDANMDCRLGDLGIARMLDSATDMAGTVIGTVPYMSPELFMNIPYNFKTDIWSLAVVIYELATLEKPFTAMFMPMLIFEVTHGKTPDMPTGYRPELAKLLSRMMEKDPDDRPSAKEIMQDELFKRRQKPKPLRNLRGPDYYAKSDKADFKADQARLKPLLHTIRDMSVPGRKLLDLQPGARPEVVRPAESADVDNDPVMEVVTRTLKDMGHDTTRPAGKNVLQQRVDMLKLYILNALDNNKQLFDKVDRDLDNLDKDEDLEEKLIEILGHEKFGLCGMELLYYKNFTYNLRHVKK